MKAPSFDATDLVLDQEGLILRCEQDFADWLGLNRNELLGQAIHLVLKNRQPEWKPFLRKGFHRKKNNP